MQVETVCAHLAVEARDERVLRRLAWLDEVQLHAGFLCPELHCLRRELWSIVADDRLRQLPCDATQLTSDAVT